MDFNSVLSVLKSMGNSFTTTSREAPAAGDGAESTSPITTTSTDDRQGGSEKGVEERLLAAGRANDRERRGHGCGDRWRGVSSCLLVSWCRCALLGETTGQHVSCDGVSVIRRAHA